MGRCAPHQIEAMNIIQGQAEKINLQRRISRLPEISNPIPEVLHEYNKNGIVFHIILLCCNLILLKIPR